MPIQGLTTGRKHGLLYMPTIGKIRKGAAKVSDRKPGEDLTYFRITFSSNYEGRGFEQEAESLYGPEPTSLSAFVYGASADDAFQTGYEEWNAATMLHRCDGETQSRHYDPQKNRYLDTPIACRKPGERGCDSCKAVGRLCVILPDFGQRTGVFGVFTFETHSIHDIIAVHRMLVSAEQVNKNRFHPNLIATHGAFYGVPFVLERGKKKISTPNGNGGRAMRDKWLVTLAYAPAYTQFALLVQSNALELESGDYPALPANVATAPVTGEELEEVTGELMPETVPTPAPKAQEPTPHFADDPALLETFIARLSTRIAVEDIGDFMRSLDFQAWGELPSNITVAGITIKTRLLALPGSAKLPFRLVASKATYHKTSKGARFDVDAIVPLQWFGHRADFCRAVGYVGNPESIEDGTVIEFEALGFGWVAQNNYRLAELPVIQSSFEVPF